MKRPSAIRILGKTFHIKYVSGRPLAEDEAGMCDSDAQTLYVCDGQSLQGEQDTILHEVLHALEHLLGVHLKHSDVVRLTTGLHALLRDNPTRLTQYLRRINTPHSQPKGTDR